jgi:hypothetical protein
VQCICRAVQKPRKIASELKAAGNELPAKVGSSAGNAAAAAGPAAAAAASFILPEGKTVSEVHILRKDSGRLAIEL